MTVQRKLSHCFHPACHALFLIVLGLITGCGGEKSTPATPEQEVDPKAGVSVPAAPTKPAVDAGAVMESAIAQGEAMAGAQAEKSSPAEVPAESKGDPALVAAKKAVMAANAGNPMEGLSAGMQSLVQQAQSTESELRQLSAGMQMAQQKALTNSLVVAARKDLEDTLDQVIAEKNPELSPKWKRLRELGSQLEANPELQGTPDPSKISPETRKAIEEVQALSQEMQSIQQVLATTDVVQEKQKAFVDSMETAMKAMDPEFDQKLAKQQELVRRMQDLQRSFMQQQQAAGAPMVPPAPSAPAAPAQP